MNPDEQQHWAGQTQYVRPFNPAELPPHEDFNYRLVDARLAEWERQKAEAQAMQAAHKREPVRTQSQLP